MGAYTCSPGIARSTWSGPFWLLGGGIVLSGIGCYLRDRWMGIPLFTRKDLPQLWEVPFLLIIIGAAVYLRFWLLDKIPEGIWFDEAEIGLETRRILEGAAYSPMGAYSQNPSFPFYYNALFLKVLGDTLFALRCAVAVSGVLAVVGMYFLARELFGRWAGLIAAMLLACGFWHINFSRFNMQNVHAPLFAIWMFYFFFEGCATGDGLTFYSAVVMLGLGMHSYTGFRVVPPVLIPLTLIAMIFQKRFLRDYLYPLILMAVFSILVFGPLAAFAVRDWDKFTERTKETSVFRNDDGRRSEEQQWRDFKKNLIEHYQMFHYWGDRNPRHGLAAHPKVDFISGVLMMLGLALAFYHLRDPRYFLLPVWLALGLLAGILSLEFESPQTARTIALLPVPFLLGGAALDQVRRFLISILPSFGKFLFGALAIVLLGWACNLNFDIYFNKQMTRGDTWSEFSGRDTAVARFMATLDQNDLCYNNNATTRQSSYLIPEPKFQSRDFVTFRDLPPVEVFQSNQKISYILENWRAPLPERLWKHYFPTIQYEQHVNPENSPVFLYTHSTRFRHQREAWRTGQLLPAAGRHSENQAQLLFKATGYRT